MSWVFNSNTFHHYPFCWFMNLAGCETEVPSQRCLDLVKTMPRPEGPLKVQIAAGDCSRVLHFDKLLGVFVASCAGLAVAVLFAYVVRNEFCMRTLKSTVATIGMEMNQMRLSELNFGKFGVSEAEVGDAPSQRDDSHQRASRRPAQRRRQGSRSRSGSRSISFARSTDFPEDAPQSVVNLSISTIKSPPRYSNGSQERLQEDSKATDVRSESPYKNFILELHQHPRGNTVPCESLWGMRLECLLRTMKISYTAIFDCGVDQHPWLMHRDFQTQSHSMFNTTDGSGSSIIEYLCVHFPESRNLLNDHRKKVPGHFLTSLVENHLIPILTKALELNKYPIVTCTQPEEFDPGHKKELLDDLMSLSAALNDKTYFLGKRVSEVDCTIFAALAQMIWAKSDTPVPQLVHRHSNLVDYCLRVKSALWPDWNCNIQILESEFAGKAKSQHSAPATPYFTPSDSESEDI